MIARYVCAVATATCCRVSAAANCETRSWSRLCAAAAQSAAARTGTDAVAATAVCVCGWATVPSNAIS